MQDVVVPVIDRCYPLDELPEAMRYLATGHARGKIVMTSVHRATPPRNQPGRI